MDSKGFTGGVSCRSKYGDSLRENIKSTTDSDDERNKEAKLYSAIHKGKLLKVKELLKEGVKPNIIDRNNKDNTPLHYAVDRGREDVLEELLLKKWETDVNARNANGDTPLHIAASKAAEGLVQLLVRKGANICISNNEGKTPVEISSGTTAILFENYSKLSLNERLFTRIDVPADGSCLFWATTLSYLNSVKCDDNAFRERFVRLFGSTSSAVLIKQVQELMQGHKPAMYNSTIYKNETLNQLVTEKLRKRVIDEISSHESKFKESITLKDFLRTKNEDYFTSGTFQKRFLVEFGNKIRDNNIGMLKLRTFDESAVQIIDNELNKIHDQDKVKYFKLRAYLESMSNVKSRGGNKEIQAMAEMLLCNIHVFFNGIQHTFNYKNSGDQIQLFNNGESCYSLGVVKAPVLMGAIKSNELKAAETYLSFGIDDVNYSDDCGWTPLHFAAQYGNIHIVEMLLSQGGSSVAKNSFHQAPIDVVNVFEKDSVFCLLSRNSQVGVCNKKESVRVPPIKEQPSQGVLDIECRPEEINIKELPIADQKHVQDDLDMIGSKKFGLISGTRSIQDSKKQLSFSKGGSAGIKGGIYQAKLLMLFLYRAVEKNYSFRLATEMDAAEKFDDLVFEYTENNKNMYRFLQAKHREDESKKIAADELITPDPGDFSLLKYFNSYRKIIQKPDFQGGTVRDFIICTNINFNYDDNNGKFEIGSSFEKISQRDDILDTRCKGKETLRYQFKKNFPGKEVVYDTLRKASHLSELAQSLAQCVLYDKPVQHHSNSNKGNAVFKLYHVALAKEVIDIRKKIFHSDFLNPNSENLSEPTKVFRVAFKKELKKEIRQYIDSTSVKNKKKKMKDIFCDPHCEKDPLEQILHNAVQLQLSKGFGEGTEEENIPNDNILDVEIEEFFDHLVFAVNQPNEVQLGNIIKSELGKEFNNIDRKNVYSRFLEKILDWMKEKEGKFFSHEEGKTFFEELKKEILGTIWFNVKDHVQLFTGREEELRKLHNEIQCSSKGVVVSQMTSISGLGGIGKSELARKYACDYYHYFDGNVIWLNAEKYETLVNSFHDLAVDGRIDIPVKSKDGTPKSIDCIVKEIYRFFRMRKSLFIFDNAENAEHLKKFLPLNTTKPDENKPYILITSREKEWEDGISVIALKELKMKDTIQLVKKGLNIVEDDKSQDQDIKRLGIKLQCFPLAMQQAISYIKDQRLTEEYEICDYLREYEEKTKELLNSEVFRGIDNDYVRTSFTTWKITTDKIGSDKSYGPLALNILNATAYLTPENIDRKIFLSLCTDDKLNAEVRNEMARKANKLFNKYFMLNCECKQSEICILEFMQEIKGVFLTLHTSENEKKIKSAVRLLCRYSMLNGERNQSVLNIHRLVQEVMRIEMKDRGQEEHVLEQVMCLIIMNIEKYLDHAVCAWEHVSKYRDLVKEFCYVPSYIIHELNENVRYKEAHMFGQNASTLIQEVIGHDDPLISLGTAHSAAQALDLQGKHDEAAEIFKKVLDKSKELDPDHCETLATMHELAVVCYEQGKYDESLKIYQEVLCKEKEKHGLDHPHVLVTMENIGSVLSKQENYEEALKNYEVVLQKRRHFLGCDHPDTLAAQNNRATVLRSQGKYGEALKEFYEVLMKRKQILGDNHRYTLYTMHDIAYIVMKQGKYDESLKSFKEVLAKTEEILTPDHPDVLAPMDCIAVVLIKQGKYNEGLEAYQKVVNKKIELLGPDHPEILYSMHDIANALFLQRNFGEVLKIYQDMLEMQKRILGSDHPDTLRTMSLIARLS